MIRTDGEKELGNPIRSAWLDYIYIYTNLLPNSIYGDKEKEKKNARIQR